MKRILISQRCDAVEGRDEVRDCLDVRWAKILFDLNFIPLPVCSELANEVGYIEQLKPDGILLSGGNDLGQAPKRDQLERQLLDYAIAKHLPVLGVCRGMQMLNRYFGGSLVDVAGHEATRHVLEGEWAKKSGYQQVNSYHNQGVVTKTLAEPLTGLASTQDGVIKALKHFSLPLFGIMWHPEREQKLNNADSQLIKNMFTGKNNEKL
jgi:gamma-glutamyl-gamma-aminobutyrate hydrolase PuuD